MYDKNQLIALFREKALKFGDFTLASGKKAKYYLDGKQVTLDAAGARLVGEGMLELLAAQEKGTAPFSDGRRPSVPDGARSSSENRDSPLAGAMPECIGGMSIGADPIVGATIAMAAVRGLPLKGFMVRKESKGHGTNRFLEGPVEPGQTAAIVEDVVTTGGSSLLAIERAEQFGLKIVGVLAIVDRMEGGAEAFRQRGYPFASLLSIRDFGIEPPTE